MLLHTVPLEVVKVELYQVEAVVEVLPAEDLCLQGSLVVLVEGCDKGQYCGLVLKKLIASSGFQRERVKVVNGLEGIYL